MHNKSKQETKEEAIVRLYKADESIGAIRRMTGARLDRVEYTINNKMNKFQRLDAAAGLQMVTTSELAKFLFRIIPNPKYSPDVSPLDFRIFRTVKFKMPNELIDS